MIHTTFFHRLIKLLIKILFIITFAGITILFFLYNQTNHLTLTTSKISSSKIPISFNNYKIVQLSDLHSKSFGPNQSHLLKFISHAKPDIIVITGDLIDGNTKLQEPCLQLIKNLSNIAPTYYIYGNHESPILYSDSEKTFFDKIQSYHVKTLYNEAIPLTSTQNEQINLIGITDPCTILPDAKLIHISGDANRINYMLNTAFNTVKNLDNYNILLSHRPEFLSIYANYPIDLVLCGHVHGGQIRLPFVGGLYSSDQGLFPKYDAGKYQEKNTTMLISRGLGTGSFPIRIFNYPEVHLIILNHLN